MTAGARQKRHREREKNRIVVLQIEAPEVALWEVLQAAGFIPENVGGRAALTAGFQRAVDIWCLSRVTVPHDETW